METNGSMLKTLLKNYQITTTPIIIIYLEADINDGDCVGKITTLSLTKNYLDYLRVITYIFCNNFKTEYWKRANAFSKYGIGDCYDFDDSFYEDDYDDDYDDEYDENDKDDDDDQDDSLIKMKLELIYHFMDKYLPSSPTDDTDCHSITDFHIYIISSERSGELMYENVTDEEIIRVWQANKANN